MIEVAQSSGSIQSLNDHKSAPLRGCLERATCSSLRGGPREDITATAPLSRDPILAVPGNASGRSLPCTNWMHQANEGTHGAAALGADSSPLSTKPQATEQSGRNFRAWIVPRSVVHYMRFQATQDMQDDCCPSQSTSKIREKGMERKRKTHPPGTGPHNGVQDMLHSRTCPTGLTRRNTWWGIDSVKYSCQLIHIHDIPE